MTPPDETPRVAVSSGAGYFTAAARFAAAGILLLAASWVVGFSTTEIGYEQFSLMSTGAVLLLLVAVPLFLAGMAKMARQLDAWRPSSGTSTWSNDA